MRRSLLFLAIAGLLFVQLAALVSPAPVSAFQDDVGASIDESPADPITETPDPTETSVPTETEIPTETPVPTETATSVPFPNTAPKRDIGTLSYVTASPTIDDPGTFRHALQRPERR